MANDLTVDGQHITGSLDMRGSATITGSSVDIERLRDACSKALLCGEGEVENFADPALVRVVVSK